MEKKIYIIIASIIIAIVLLATSFIVWYKIEQKAPNINNADTIIEIKSGESTVEIVKELKDKKIIKSELATKIFIKLHEINSLKAGKYLFSGKEDLRQVLEKLIQGNVMDETIKITFKEGKNMRSIVSEIAEKTSHSANDVYSVLENKTYISSLVDKYWFLNENIKNNNIYYPLEGYLYPDTYIFENKDVKIEKIFETMLDQMSKVLSKYKTQIESSKYSVHDILTIASIVELEGNNSTNRANIAQVIYNRLSTNMSLGSDVTTYYAFKIDMGTRDLYSKEINTANPYNTRGPDMAGKLPVGPIDSPSEDAIQATLNPTKGKYLYFVADKNGEIYFSETYEEHQNIINTLKKKGLWYEY